MKTHEEIYQSAIERRNSYQAKRARIIRGVTLSAACFAVVAVAVIGVRGMRLGKSADAADIKSTDDIEYIVNYGGSERNEAGGALPTAASFRRIRAIPKTMKQLSQMKRTFAQAHPVNPIPIKPVIKKAGISIPAESQYRRLPMSWGQSPVW